MKYTWLDGYCTGKKGIEKDYKTEWGATRYMIRGKMFAMVTARETDHKEIISVKLDPMYGAELRKRYKDIEPGYYMNKTHWNSIDLNGSVPDDELKRMIDQSYSLIFQSMSKKAQAEIGGF